MNHVSKFGVGMHIICKALVILCVLTGGFLASVFLEPGITWKLTGFMPSAIAGSGPVAEAEERTVLEEIASEAKTASEAEPPRDRLAFNHKGVCFRLVPREVPREVKTSHSE